MNKKKRTALKIGIALIVLVAFTAPAAADNYFYFVPQDSSAAPEGAVTVSLMLHTDEANIGAFQCHIDIDTSVVTVIAGEDGDFPGWDYWNWVVKEDGDPNPEDPEYGPYLFTAGMEFGGCGPGELYCGNFTLKGVNPGVSPLDFIRVQQPGEPEPHPDPTTENFEKPQSMIR